MRILIAFGHLGFTVLIILWYGDFDFLLDRGITDTYVFIACFLWLILLMSLRNVYAKQLKDKRKKDNEEHTKQANKPRNSIK